MSYTFTNNPAGRALDAVRILLHDTSSGTAKLSDETIDWLLAAHPNTYLAAAAGAETISSEFSAVAVKEVGDLRLEYRTVADGYGALAKSLRRQGVRRVAPTAGGISQSAKDAQYADTDMVRPPVRHGQFDNLSESTST